LSEAANRDEGGAQTAPTQLPRRRVLWLSHLLPWPPKGGVMQRSYYLMREVARYHELAVIAFRQRAHQPDASAASKRRRRPYPNLQV
jgi:hypothetical protein